MEMSNGKDLYLSFLDFKEGFFFFLGGGRVVNHSGLKFKGTLQLL